ncbi:MAG TPA: endo-1,4-beta-xylanase [Firmicutes bacterium]|jgi:endo-1,4-beta-xylanase|nr:endo-1,4-beta-xylanase [Bacillota bacterium]
MKKHLFYLLLALVMIWCITGGCQQEEEISALHKEVPALAEVYQDFFPVGAAVNSWTIESHKELIEKHFNSLTAENEMKFESIQRSPGKYTFERADAIVELAEKNGMLVRGHTLVWHSQTPAWVFKDEKGRPASRELLLKRMEEHITTVVSRYRGQVYAWDVVNEAVTDGGGPGYLRTDSPWYRIIGPGYIAQAFIFAHRADPGAKLFYNDYSAVDPAKSDRIYRLLKDLLEQGVPVHGVGIQGHWDISYPSANQVEAAIRKYASLGLEVQITELDISVFPWSDRGHLRAAPKNRLRTQAQRYRELFEVFRRNKDVVTGVTFWGVADDRTWKDNFPVRGRKDWPLVFDEEHQPKAAFWEIVNF